ncbi:zinc ribbon domain-containing protein [Dictyoglomus sp.]|jgi:predicted  nucleic acid-binding Zn-ribbon protein|uniref:zinc ribbon domain-containing protein n=1 Tax=Dictyoglomus sp. TaxID=28205 RepID=UPI003D10E4B1
MKRELIPKLLEIQDLQLKYRESEKNLKGLQAEFDIFKNEKLGEIKLKEENLINIRDQIKKLRDQQREKEDQLVLLKEKLTNEERRILILKNPKEVMHMEKEIENLKSLISKIEDEILNLMIELEEKTKTEKELEKAFNESKITFDNKVKEYEEKIKNVENEIELLHIEIEDKRKEIPTDDLEEFDKLSKQKNYKPIARVNRDVCEGCKIAIPKVVLERVKRNEIVNCPNCGRILWVE